MHVIYLSPVWFQVGSELRSFQNADHIDLLATLIYKCAIFFPTGLHVHVRSLFNAALNRKTPTCLFFFLTHSLPFFLISSSVPTLSFSLLLLIILFHLFLPPMAPVAHSLPFLFPLLLQSPFPSFSTFYRTNHHVQPLDFGTLNGTSQLQQQDTHHQILSSHRTHHTPQHRTMLYSRPTA